MRSIAIASIAVVAVVLGGILTIKYLERSAQELSMYLERVQEAVQRENWSQAEELFDAANSRWDQIQRPWAALISHGELDELQMTFGRIKQYITCQEKSLALAELEVARLLVEHIPEKEKPHWTNIF